MKQKTNDNKDRITLLLKALASSLFGGIEKHTTKVLTSARKEILLIEERVVRRLAIALVSFVGYALLISGILLYLIDIRGFQRSTLFLGVGIVILALNFIMKYQDMKARSQE